MTTLSNTHERICLILTLLKLQHEDEKFSELFPCVEKYKDIKFSELKLSTTSAKNPCLSITNSREGRSLITGITQNNPPIFIVWETVDPTQVYWNSVPRQLNVKTVIKHISFEDKI